MAQIYNKKDLFEQAKKAIKDNNLFFFSDVIAFLPCHADTFYQYFRPDEDEHTELREMLENNKIRTKSAIRSKLFKSDKAGELLALYRLICTPDERRMLNQQYIEMNTNDKGLTVNFIDKSKDDDK